MIPFEVNRADADPEFSYRQCIASEAAVWKILSDAGVRSWADAFEFFADHYPDNIAVLEAESGQQITYRELDRAAEAVAVWLASACPDPMIGLHQENGIDFLIAALGLAKAGRTGVLLNTRIPLQAAAALAAEAGVRLVLGTKLPGLQAAPPCAGIARTPVAGRQRMQRQQISLDQPCWIIFTSGTSGRSKGALFSHRRMIGAGIAWSLRAGLGQTDRCYIPLPLYHGNALAVAFSSCVTAGAAAVVRQRFSVSAFLGDIRACACTAAVYIGELWRYLDRAAAQPEDAATPLRVIFGNGLSAGLWQRTVRRYGIAHVVEHYGATELPAGALTNWTGRAGYCGYIPPGHPDAADVALIDENLRKVENGQPGEIVIRIKSGSYRGYLDPAHDAGKVLADLFAPGDLWWRSGDLLVRDAQGYFSFVERCGDGFRWKGENVAAVDVEDAIRATGLVSDCAVFGVTVPHHEGKAGAAVLVVRDGAPDLVALLAHLRAAVPPYALPRFLWLSASDLPATSTLKVTKAALARRVWEDLRVSPSFVLEAAGYRPLNSDLVTEISEGRRSVL